MMPVIEVKTEGMASIILSTILLAAINLPIFSAWGTGDSIICICSTGKQLRAFQQEKRNFRSKTKKM